ncbi:NUDIX hydrolase [Kitasatospora sp. NPDC006697]|uniref:NUDIX hydrolase n=1 Tax=Kitasatospora sp. NPDC006697 TaxID=3364020 RepID=UPI0036C5233F
MNHGQPAPAPVELLEARRVRLVETAPPEPSAAQRVAMERVWAAEVRANPAFFDGPVTICTGARWAEPGTLELSWARSSFRHRALCQVPGAGQWSSFFVTVLQRDERGRLLVGRQSGDTAAPGRWQPAGGLIEPPAPGAELDLAALARHAAVELAEELGIRTPARQLAPAFVTRGAHGNTGVHFLAPPRPAAELLARHAELAAAERAAGREPELERLALIADPAELLGLEGTLVDYLVPVAAWGLGRR